MRKFPAQLGVGGAKCKEVVTLKLKTIFCLVLSAALLCGVLAVNGFAAGTDLDSLDVKVESSGTHTAAMMEGDLYVWGRNESGQFPKSKEAYSLEPIKVLSKVTDVAVANSRTLVLLEDGSLYAYGYDPLTEDTQVAKKIANGVAQMDCSDSFAAFVTSDGAVYTWGSNSYGQLGTGDTEDKSSPVKVIESGVKKVVCGQSFVLALHTNGSVSGWGDNSGCQIGYTVKDTDGNLQEQVLSPVTVMTSGIKDIDAGNSYSCFLKNNGDLYTGGRNELSQLGIGTLDGWAEPTRILSGIRYVSAGGNHGFAIGDNSTIYNWGFGVEGQLGDGTRERVIDASAAKDIGDYVIVFSGEVNTFALDKSGKLYAWGSNDQMQLGKQNGAESIEPVMILNSDRQWAFGSEGDSDEDNTGNSQTPSTDSGIADDETTENTVLGFVSGYPDGTFRPDAQTTRAEFLTMLVTALGDYDKEETYTASTFADVSADDWFGNVVAYAQETGLVKGYEDNTFRPDDNITRAEAAAMTASAMGLTADATTSSFTDVTGWAVPHVEALAKLGILSGDGDGTFRPDDNIIRCEAVTIVAHAIGFDADSEEVQTALQTAENPFSDVPADSWAYAYILRAAGLVG